MEVVTMRVFNHIGLGLSYILRSPLYAISASHISYNSQFPNFPNHSIDVLI